MWINPAYPQPGTRRWPDPGTGGLRWGFLESMSELTLTSKFISLLHTAPPAAHSRRSPGTAPPRTAGALSRAHGQWEADLDQAAKSREELRGQLVEFSARAQRLDADLAWQLAQGTRR